MKDIIELERECLAWSKKVFTEATAISSLEKLKDEIKEIENNIANGERPLRSVGGIETDRKTVKVTSPLDIQILEKQE